RLSLRTRVVGDVGVPDWIGPVVFLAPNIVDVDPTGAVGPQGLPQLPRPADVALRLRRVEPLGDEDQVTEDVAVGVGRVTPPHGTAALLEEQQGQGRGDAGEVLDHDVNGVVATL